MAHELENMFYTSNEENGRFVPWHGLGTPVKNSPTAAEAIKLAGLDWSVNSKPVFTDAGIEIPNYRANTRSSDNSVLGIVSDRYKIVQNSEAFDFVDNLIGDGAVKYDTAGSLMNGKKIWLLAKLPQRKVLGDDVDTFVCFTNSHDGMGAIKACITPVRVVCNNTLNFALSTAKRSWSTKHVGDIQAKISEARHTLELADEYMDKFAESADVLANTSFKTDDILKALDEMFPVGKDTTDRQKANIQKARDGILACVLAPDLANFFGTAYGFVNAVSDFATHANPARMTGTYRENNFARVIDGHPLIDAAYKIAMSAVNA